MQVPTCPASTRAACPTLAKSPLEIMEATVAPTTSVLGPEVASGLHGAVESIHFFSIPPPLSLFAHPTHQQTALASDPSPPGLIQEEGPQK